MQIAQKRTRKKNVRNAYFLIKMYNLNPKKIILLCSKEESFIEM